MLSGVFRVHCDGELHRVEIDEEGFSYSPDNHHDFALERTFVDLGAKPSDCMRFVMEHGFVVTSALESILWELFPIVFDDDHEDIDYGEPTKRGVALPKTAYNSEMEITDGVMNSVGISDDDRYRIEQEARELGLEFKPYASGISLAGALSLNWFPKLEDVIPENAIVLAEGAYRGEAYVFVEEAWIDHGVIEESDDLDAERETAAVEFYYKWAVYTTLEVLRDKRREKLEEFIEEQLSEIDGWLNEAGGFADEKDCEAAHGALAEHVYPAYAALADRLSDPDAMDDVSWWPHSDIRYHHKVTNIDLAWMTEIEHDCGLKRPDSARKDSYFVLEFFQKVYNEAKKTDEAADALVASLAEDEE